MAYGLRWFSEFKDVKGRLCRVEVLERDYAGAASEVISAGEPIVISYTSDYSDDPFGPVRPQKATIKWISDEDSGFDIHNLFITDDQKFKVAFSVDGANKWNGYIASSECEEPYMSRPYPVIFNAACGLSFLDRHEVVDANGKYFYSPLGQPIIDLVKEGLRKIGHPISTLNFVNLNEPGKSGLLIPPEQFNFMSTNIDPDGLAGLTYRQFFEQVLNAFNAYITQSDGKWVIQDIRGQTQTDIQYQEYSPSFTFSGVGTKSKSVKIIRPSVPESERFIRPTSDVIAKIALPKSKIKVDVQPGVQVNRLQNGRFYSSNGVDPQGWQIIDNNPAPWDHSIGDGSPSNPFKLQFKNFRVQGQDLIRSNIITLNIEQFGEKNTADHNICLNISGNIKAENTARLWMQVRINYDERDFVDYLLTDGTWDQRKVDKKGPEYFKIGIPAKEGFFGYDGLPLCPFSIKTKPIVNWLNRSEGWLAKIQIEISSQGSFEGFSANKSIWLEDFAISIDTGTPYEGNHTYEIDATKTILNGEEYSYTIGVADKISISTLEQRRPSNRVMTNYMKIANTLTGQWNRLINGANDPEDPTSYPIQYLSIKERIRQLCGKRQMLEGTFIGSGVYPDSTIINEVESGWSTMCITSWSWNVKDNEYDLSLLELNFSKLDNEDVFLVVEDENGRPSRVYSGGAGISSGGSNTKGSPIVVDDIPLIPGVVKSPISKVVDIYQYVVSDHEAESLQLRFLTKPSWAIVEIDELTVSVTGKPDEVGEDQILIEVSDGTGDEYIVSIPLLIFPVTTVTYTLTPGGKLSVTTPKQLPYAADPRTATVEVDGGHDAHRMTVKGTGVNLDTDLVEHAYTESATYSPFPAQAFPEGIFDVAYIHYRKTGTDPDSGDPIYAETHRSRATFIHGENLGDSDPNRRAVISLLSGGAALAEITGTETILKFLESWNLTVSPIGILATKFVVTISPEEEPYYKEMVPNRTDVTGSTTAVRLNPADGTTTADPGYNTTDPVPVTTGDRIWIYGTDLIAVGYNAGAYVQELTGPEIIIPAGVTHIRVCSQTDPVKVERVVIPPGEFQLFPSDAEKPSGRYSVFLRAFDDAGEEIYQKYGKFQILGREKEVPAAAGGLKLITEGASVSVVAELPVTGGVYPLPSDGFDVLHDVTDTEVDKITWEAFHLVNGGWQAINIPLYTGYPTEAAYPVAVTEATIQAFGAKNSLQIGDIHATGRFLFRFTDWLLGEKVGISESDFRLKPNTPVGPDSGMAFAYFYPASDSFAIEDEELPTTGGYYPFQPYDPGSNKFWSVYFETFDGATAYNRIVTEVDGAVAAEWSGPSTTTLPDALYSEYYTWGALVDNKRVVGGQNIDAPGLHTVVHKFYDGTTLLGQKSVTLELYEDVGDPEPIDPSECCDGNIKTTGDQTKEGVLTFADSPIVPDAIAGNQAVNLDQVTDLIVAVTGMEIPFTTPSEEWLWMHNQNRKPTVQVIVGGFEVAATVQYLDNDTLKVVFTKPQTGSILIR